MWIFSPKVNVFPSVFHEMHAIGPQECGAYIRLIGLVGVLSPLLGGDIITHVGEN